MNRDFTLEKYRELCDAIVENYFPMSVESYLTKQPVQDYIAIIRHDVDKKPKKALEMAELEKEYNINSTYYFRMNRSVFIPEIIRKIAKMGHEVGYHYEVLDRAKGDPKKAITIFERDLKEFRKICDVKTICMHGNPLTPWINAEIWKKYDLKRFDIIGEPYISIQDAGIMYVSDTGRSWSGKFSVKDKINTSKLRIDNTDMLIKLIRRRKIKKLHILTHPNRWSDSFVEWVVEFIWQNVKNIGKAGIVRYRRF